MQFRGHSLPVHQSMSVSWAFTLSHFVCQIRLRDFFRLLAIGMCHFLPVHHFGMACSAGSKVKIQQSAPLTEWLTIKDLLSFCCSINVLNVTFFGLLFDFMGYKL